MNAVPSGLIKVRIRGCPHIYLVRAIQWAPKLIVLAADGQTYTIAPGQYPAPNKSEAEQFWLTLEQAVYDRHTSSRN